MGDRADLVIVGAGTIGGWASVFAHADGVGRVVVVERGLVGMGASSRAAGIVRAQGGTPATVALGRWSIDFYHGQQAAYGTDSGFRELGYLILAVTDEDERAGRERVAMQQANGLAVRWLDAAEAATTAVTLAPDGHRGGSFIETDGAIDPPRNVRAYSLAMHVAGVEIRGARSSRACGRRRGRQAVTAVDSAGVIETARVRCVDRWSVAARGRPGAGLRIPAGAARHTVGSGTDGLRGRAHAMVFDLARACTGASRRAGCCSVGATPTRRRARRAGSTGPLRRSAARPAGRRPRRIWAATIDPPDHLPILGPAVRRGPDRGATVAPRAARHDVGPGVRGAADLAVHGQTSLSMAG